MEEKAEESYISPSHAKDVTPMVGAMQECGGQLGRRPRWMIIWWKLRMLPSIAIERYLTEYRLESQLDITSPQDDVLYRVWILGLRLEPEDGR